MNSRIKQLFTTLTSVGKSEHHSYTDKIKIRILNQCNWIALLGAIAIFCQSRYLNRGDIAIELICLSLFVFPLIFNALGNPLMARFISTIVFPVFVLALAITYGPKSSVEYIYFSSILMTLILYESVWFRILNISGIAVIFLINFHMWQTYGGIYPMKPSVFNDSVIFFGVTLSIASIVHNYFEEHKSNYQLQLNYNATLADRNEKLEHYIEQNEAKNQLIQIVAHDLKNPAATFLDLTQKMSYLIRREEPQRLIQLADHIEQSGTNFFYTLNNLLNWVISQQEGIKVDQTSFSLRSLINEIVLDLNFMLQPKALTVAVPVSDELYISSDRNIMKIILNNLLHNAIKFSEPNDKIILSYDTLDKTHHICITDFGQGMDKQMIDLIQRGDINQSTPGTQHEKGYGLGLKICYRMVDFLKGELKIKSHPGAGCQFTINIPIEHELSQATSKPAKTVSKKIGQRKSDL